MTEELKPCPFCGSLAVGTEQEVCCSDTQCPTSYHEVLTLAEWNHRPIEDALQARIDELEQANSRECHWKYMNAYDEDGNYDTECGDSFTLMDGTLAENHMNYCSFCGGLIVVEPAPPEVEG